METYSSLEEMYAAKAKKAADAAIEQSRFAESSDPEVVFDVFVHRHLIASASERARQGWDASADAEVVRKAIRNATQE